MALFQPTNITPDLKGGVKNGVVLIPSGSLTLNTVDVSWSVNGNSTMTAYQIDFYQNTAASTQTGTTGKITLTDPFSAKSADGAETRFTATVDFSLFSGTYAGTGTLRGKFKITMWWGTGANEYVEQRSLSVFEVSKEGSLSVSATVISGGDVSLSGAYMKPLASLYGDIPLNWTRWQIFLGSVGGEPVQDTGKVWGATNYDWTPDTLAPGMYIAKLSAEQSNGAEIYGVSNFFTVLQSDTVSVNGIITTNCDQAIGAVQLTLQTVGTCRETITGNPERIGVEWSIPVGSSVTYEIPGYLYSGSPWSLIWHGTFDPDTPIFEIQCKDGTIVTCKWNSSTGRMRTTPLTSKVNTWSIATGDETYICFTTGYFNDDSDSGFQWLFYSPDSPGHDNRKLASYTQSEIVSITLCGGTNVLGFTIGFGPNNDEIKAGYNDPTRAAAFEGPKAFYPDSNLNCGVYYLGTQNGNEALFRQDGSGKMTYISKFEAFPGSSFDTVLLDYSAVNGQTYQYLVIEGGEENGNAAIAYSATITPCFWDWLLIEAAPEISYWTGKNQSYRALQIFRFSCNVSSGSYTNRGARNIQPTFTPYPAVFRSTQNSRQGTLTGLIGRVTGGVYYDSNVTEAALRALSSSRNQLFIRDRRGNLIKIALAGEIGMSVNDSTAKQEITVSVPWVETGSAENTGVFDVDFVEHVEPES